LDQNFNLQIQNEELILNVIPNIADISIGTEAYVVTKDGQILMGSAKYLTDDNALSSFKEIQLP